MAKTNLQRNAAYYARLIKEAKESPHSEKYNKVCAALEQLVQVADKLKGVNHKMSQKEYENLVQEYSAVQNACQEYLNAENFNEFEEKRKGIISDIAAVAAMDMDVLVKCNPMNPGTLSDIMEKSRTEKVILTKKDFEMVGGAQSSRIPIITNSGKKGFFTIAKKFNLDKEWQKSLKKYEDKFSTVSEECKEKLQLLKTDEAFQSKIAGLIPNGAIRRNERVQMDVIKNMVQLAHALGMGRDSSEILDYFKKNKDIYNALIDYSNSVIELANKQGIMAVAGIKKGSNISSRNCAMTDMAKMLGCSHLLANSAPMKVEIDGVEVDGVFMESAEGTDINRLKENDDIFQADFKSFENPEALQQIVDLQVLDFICGNVDRHTGNMFYQFKKKMFGGVTFTGIKGIDNDCAFGTPDVVNGKNLMQLVKVDKMKFITPDMVRSLENIKEPMLKMKLAHHNLSQDEIKAAWDRLNMIKTAAKNGTLTIVDKSYWSKNPLSKYEDAPNYISRIQSVQLACDPEENEFKEDYKKGTDLSGDSEIKYAQETVTAAQIMAENEDNIRGLREKMDASKARVFDSSEYKLMKSSFEKIEKYTKEVKMYNDPKQVPEKITNALRNAYIEMAKKTERYIALKKIVPSTVKGEKRLDVAKDLKKSADFMLNKLHIRLDKEVEKETEEIEKEADAPEM